LLFSRSTEKVATEQLSKVKWASDPSGVEMYTKILPRKKSPNQLPKWMSNRPESSLEKVHESLAHYGNTGMRPNLADALTLAGVCKHNVVCRWKNEMNVRRNRQQEITTPYHFEHLPPFWDHAFLAALNDKAAKLGLSPIFDFVTTIRQNNGEVFLSKYFYEQEVRNKENKQHSFNPLLCGCMSCATFQPSPLGKGGGEQKQDDNVERQTREQQNLPVPQPKTQHPKQVQQQLTCVPIGQPVGWMPIPSDACIPHPPFYCGKFGLTLQRKMRGESVKGRPAHDLDCRVRMTGVYGKKIY